MRFRYDQMQGKIDDTTYFMAPLVIRAFIENVARSSQSEATVYVLSHYALYYYKLQHVQPMHVTGTAPERVVSTWEGFRKNDTAKYKPPALSPQLVQPQPDKDQRSIVICRSDDTWIWYCPYFYIGDNPYTFPVPIPPKDIERPPEHPIWWTALTTPPP